MEWVCGVGEALQLRLADIDLNNGLITIRRTTFSNSRLVPLGSVTVQLLWKYMAPAGKIESVLQPSFPVAATQAPRPLYGRRQLPPAEHPFTSEERIGG